MVAGDLLTSLPMQAVAWSLPSSPISSLHCSRGNHRPPTGRALQQSSPWESFCGFIAGVGALIFRRSIIRAHNLFLLPQTLNQRLRYGCLYSNSARATPHRRETALKVVKLPLFIWVKDLFNSFRTRWNCVICSEYLHHPKHISATNSHSRENLLSSVYMWRCPAQNPEVWFIKLATKYFPKDE